MSNIFKIFNPAKIELDNLEAFLQKENFTYQLSNNYYDYKLEVRDKFEKVDKLKDIFENRFYLNEDKTFVEFFHDKILEANFTLSGAESCTGGLIAKLITDTPGSSKYFKHSLITYSNDSKKIILNVSEETLKEKGAVSKGTIVEMLDGLLYIQMTNLIYAISGLAGPDGDDKDNPVGTVFIGVMRNGIREIEKYHFSGDRVEIRNKAAQQLLWNLYKQL